MTNANIHHQEERRFKAGDKVVIARIASKYNEQLQSRYKKYIGGIYTIKAVEDVGYSLGMVKDDMWYDEELEPAKNHNILEIINNL